MLDAIEFGPRRVHTLRGPRQVGKSTTAKRLIRRLLERGERRILYWSFDLSTENADIVDAVRRARRLHPDPDGIWYVFLDEVTTVPDWQLGVKYLVDNGPSDDDCILCTGSSARHVGSEQLPGRKGAGRHYLQLPVSFRDFCRDVVGLPLPEDTIAPAQALTPAGMRVLKHLNLHGDVLERAWGTYRHIGGFPAALEDYLEHGEVRENTVEMLWDIIAGDVRTAGRNHVATLKLLERVNRSLGAPLAWHALAEDMDVTQPTARDYVHLLAESFMLLVIFFWDRSGKGLSPQKQRKIYGIDPLVNRVPRLLVPGARSPEDDAVRESLIASGLFRSATERLVQAEPVVGSVGFWKSGRGTEIDFLIAADIPGGRLPVEVKGDAAAGVRTARRSIGSAFGRGLIITERVFQPDESIPTVPASVFLAALAERPERKPLAI